MTPIRSLLAVLGGMVIFQVLSQMLEVTLVAVAAGGPPADETAYLAVRNRPGVLVVRVGTVFVSGVLAGYVSARIAQARELLHAGAAAALVTVQLLLEFTTHFAPPLWTRAALLGVAGPALLLGAWVRATAAAAAPQAGAVNDGGPR